MPTESGKLWRDLARSKSTMVCFSLSQPALICPSLYHIASVNFTLSYHIVSVHFNHLLLLLLLSLFSPMSTIISPNIPDWLTRLPNDGLKRFCLLQLLYHPSAPVYYNPNLGLIDFIYYNKLRVCSLSLSLRLDYGNITTLVAS
jgi:hypothetical protein